MRLRYIDAKLKGKIMQRVFPLDACQRKPMLCPHSVSIRLLTEILNLLE